MDNELTPLSWNDKAVVCQEWQTSGLSMSKFCKQKNLAISTFSGWCARLWPSKHKSKLCEVQITNPQNSAVIASVPTPMVIEMSFGQGITARVEAVGEQIRFLLQELVHATTTIR